MKNELMHFPVNDMMMMAKTFAESGMFDGARQVAQAFVKIQAGQELGIPPFQAMSGIHIIAGKPTIGAGLMASMVKGSGKYDYKVMKHDDKICSIDFYQGKELLGNSTFTIEDARKAQTKNLDKFPKNMLFARALSNGVKWFAPDVFAGPVYVQEEMNNVTEEAQQTPDGTYAALEQHKQESTVMELPALTNHLYMKALGRINTGELDIIERLEKAFKITDEQRRGLQDRIALAKEALNEQTTVEQE